MAACASLVLAKLPPIPIPKIIFHFIDCLPQSPTSHPSSSSNLTRLMSSSTCSVFPASLLRTSVPCVAVNVSPRHLYLADNWKGKSWEGGISSGRSFLLYLFFPFTGQHSYLFSSNKPINRIRYHTLGAYLASIRSVVWPHCCLHANRSPFSSPDFRSDTAVIDSASPGSPQNTFHAQWILLTLLRLISFESTRCEQPCAHGVDAANLKMAALFAESPCGWRFARKGPQHFQVRVFQEKNTLEGQFIDFYTIGICFTISMPCNSPGFASFCPTPFFSRWYSNPSWHTSIYKVSIIFKHTHRFPDFPDHWQLCRTFQKNKWKAWQGLRLGMSAGRERGWG